MRIRNERGFTLLEVMIAMAIMLVAFTSILMVQSSSIESSIKAKRMNVVGMLAKSLMIETELLYQGKGFSDLKKEDSGQFKEPYQDYSWKRAFKEVKFPNLNMSGGEKEGASKSAEGEDRTSEVMTRVLTKYLSDAIRELTITVSWKKGAGEQKYLLSTYWVDLNSEFKAQE